MSQWLNLKDVSSVASVPLLKLRDLESVPHLQPNAVEVGSALLSVDPQFVCCLGPKDKDGGRHVFIIIRVGSGVVGSDGNVSSVLGPDQTITCSTEVMVSATS